MQQVGVYTNAMKELKAAAPSAEDPEARALYWQARSRYRVLARNSAIMARLKKARKKAIRESLSWEAEETRWNWDLCMDHMHLATIKQRLLRAELVRLHNCRRTGDLIGGHEAAKIAAQLAWELGTVLEGAFRALRRTHPRGLDGWQPVWSMDREGGAE